MLGYSIVNQKGQVTIPANIRKELNIQPEDKVVISKTDEGIVVKHSPSIKSLRGSVASKGKSEDFKKMRESFENYLASRKK